MPFGAHETMETHEILQEKINVITHFNLYAKQTRNQQLREMIVRHQQEEIRSYDELVALCRGSNRFTPISSNTNIRGVSPQQIEYGVNNPPQFAPQADATLSDSEIAIAMLQWHKNGARNAMWASLECADPNLRRALLNSAANCNNQAYEVFLFMNQQGLYQVPTLSRQSADFIYSYQPAGESLQAQYGVPTGTIAGNMGAAVSGPVGYTGVNLGAPVAGPAGYAGANLGGTAGYPGANLGATAGGAAGYAGTNRVATGAGPAGYAGTNPGATAAGAGGMAGATMGAPGGRAVNPAFYAGSRESVLYGAGAGGSGYPYQAGSSGVNSAMMTQGPARQ